MLLLFLFYKGQKKIKAQIRSIAFPRPLSNPCSLWMPEVMLPSSVQYTLTIEAMALFYLLLSKSHDHWFGKKTFHDLNSFGGGGGAYYEPVPSSRDHKVKWLRPFPDESPGVWTELMPYGSKTQPCDSETPLRKLNIWASFPVCVGGHICWY